MAYEDTLVAAAGDPEELQQRGALDLCAGKARRALILLDSAYRTLPFEEVVPFVPELVRARQLTGDTAGTGAVVRRTEAMRDQLLRAGVFRQMVPIELAAVRGDGPLAARLLRQLMRRGTESLRLLVADPDFGAVHSDTAFQDALGEARARLASQRREVQRMLAEDGS